MNNQDKFRVWCCEKREWEKDQFALLHDGKLWDVRKNHPLIGRKHIIERCLGMKDVTGRLLFAGDICRWETTEADFKPIHIINYSKNVASFLHGNRTFYQVIESGYYQAGYERNEKKLTMFSWLGNIHQNQDLVSKEELEEYLERLEQYFKGI